MENPPDREQDITSTSISVQNHAPADQPHRPHLSIDIPASSSISTTEADDVVTPTPDDGTKTRPPAAGVPPVAPAAGSSSSGTGRIPPSSRPPQRSPSFMLRQTVRSLLPVGSFKSSVVRGYEASLSKFLNARLARTSSLPSDDVSGADAHLAHHGVDKSSSTASAPEKTVRICRSQSLPMTMKKLNNNAKSFKRLDSLGGVFRVVPSSSTTPRAAAAAASNNVVPDTLPPTTTTEPVADVEEEEEEEAVGEDIPEEEAVCRICMVELSEGSDTTMRLECACRGELALVHRDCGIRWFGVVKGTRNCEVCRREVRNLPVTLVRVQSLPGSAEQANRRAAAGGDSRPRHGWYIIWHGTPILVIVSILAYFCFLEELLAARNGIAALAISLPFSCILGLFSALTTTSMVARRYVWIYAAVQFLFVVFFTHLFYKFLHLQAVISIILATFAGFGVGMTGNSIIVEILRWRVRRVAPPSTDAARRNRRARTAQRQEQAPAPAASDRTSSGSGQPSSAAADAGQSDAVAGDVENPAAVAHQA